MTLKEILEKHLQKLHDAAQGSNTWSANDLSQLTNAITSITSELRYLAEPEPNVFLVLSSLEEGDDVAIEKSFDNPYEASSLSHKLNNTDNSRKHYVVRCL